MTSYAFRHDEVVVVLHEGPERRPRRGRIIGTYPDYASAMAALPPNQRVPIDEIPSEESRAKFKRLAGSPFYSVIVGRSPARSG